MKKKLLLGIILAVAIMCLFAISVSAAETEIGGFKYKTNSDGKSATLSANVSFTGTVAEIPETVEIEGVLYTVTTIGDNIFKGNTTVEIIKFPSTITVVGGYVISKCTALTSVYIDLNNIVTIGSCGLTYNSQTGGTDMTATDANTGIYFYPTSEYGKEKPQKTTVASFDNLTSSNYASFQGLNVEKIITSCVATQMFRHSTVKEVIINGDHASIGGYAFNSCANLEIIKVNSRKLTSIGSNAFGTNPSVKEIHIDLSKVTTIEGKAFEFSENAQGGNYNSVTKWYNLDGENIVDLSKVTVIGAQAFGTSNIGMAKIIWPNGLQSIGDQVFRKANLTGEIYVKTAPGYTLTISSYTFRDNSFETIVFDENVTTIKGQAFNSNTSLKNVVFLADNVTVEDNIFNKCTSGINFYHKQITTSATIANKVDILISGGSIATYGACGFKVNLTLADTTTKELNYVSHEYMEVADQTVCPAGSRVIYTCAGCKDSFSKELENYVGGTHVFDRNNGATVVDVVFGANSYFGEGTIVLMCAHCDAQANDTEKVGALFVADGYSIPETGTTDCISHTIRVNKANVEKYEILTGNKVSYGIVAGIKDSVSNPVSVEDGKIVADDYAVFADMTGTEYTKLVIKITGLDKGVNVSCNAYVVFNTDPTKIYYLCDNKVTTEAVAKSL